MCKHCGAIVGAGETQCAVCGTPTTATPAQRRQPDRETSRFARAILARPYKFTIIILIANVFLFLLMWESSGMSSQVLWTVFPEPVLEAYGAKMNTLIASGQWWRFVTPMFIHVNLPHILVNMYSLWMVGPYVERLYGSAKFVFFWVATGIGGVVASYFAVRPSMSGNIFARFLFKTQDMPSAGASGALFGLVGVLFVFGIKFRRELPEGFKRAFGMGMLPIILINLFIGYVGRGVIDNAAHVGGLLSGAALAAVVQYRRLDESKGVAAVWRVLQIAALGLVAVSFFYVARNMSLPPPAQLQVGPITTENPPFVLYANAMNQAQEAFWQAVQDRDLGALDGAIRSLDESPSFDPKADEFKRRLKELLVRAKVEAIPAGAGGEKIRSRLNQDFVAWSKEYGAWLKEKIGNNPAPNQNQ